MDVGSDASNLLELIYLPVQNFGSSLRSPQWSIPSQYLSSGRQRLLPLQGNSDILHERISTTKFNNKTPQASVSHRMIWKMMKTNYSVKNLSLRSNLMAHAHTIINYKLLILRGCMRFNGILLETRFCGFQLFLAIMIHWLENYLHYHRQIDWWMSSFDSAFSCRIFPSETIVEVLRAAGNFSLTGLLVVNYLDVF